MPAQRRGCACAMTVAKLLLLVAYLVVQTKARKFYIDYAKNSFMKNAKPFQVVSGTMNYYNVPYPLWRDRLQSMKDCGMNTVRTQLEWRSLEPVSGQFNFTRQNDIVGFIMIAHQLGLLVDLALGPYVGVERNMGGLPWWLLKANPDMEVRSSDPLFLRYVDRYWKQVFGMIQPLLFANGGPIILVQLEDRYGSAPECDFAYTSHLRDLATRHLGSNVIYYTSDDSSDRALMCGRIAGVFTTVQFGVQHNIGEAFAVLRHHQRRGPLMNSGFQVGSPGFWGQPRKLVSARSVGKALDEMLGLKASVNIDVFHGGTNFGFTSGYNATADHPQVFLTSHDCDAPLDEAGDPTEKYFVIKDTLKKYALVPVSNPPVKPKMTLGNFELGKLTGLKPLLFALRKSKRRIECDSLAQCSDPKLLEGTVAYETQISRGQVRPTFLKVNQIHDRGYVYLDYVYRGVIVERAFANQISLDPKVKSILTIVIESQGRDVFRTNVNHGIHTVLDGVYLGPQALNQWYVYAIPDRQRGDDSYEKLVPFMDEYRHDWRDYSDLNSTTGFGVYQSTVELSAQQTAGMFDTYLRLDGWSKGFVLINGMNLGRYWPKRGPQEALYVPGVYLDYGPNLITVVELEGAPANRTVSFVSRP